MQVDIDLITKGYFSYLEFLQPKHLQMYFPALRNLIGLGIGLAPIRQLRMCAVTYIRVTGNSIFQPDRYVGACVT